MTVINNVKKVLRQTGYEMDADDVASILSTWSHLPGGVTRTQAANALQSLCTKDPDVIRTRKGMYQYRASAGPLTYPILNAAAPVPQPPVPRASDAGQLIPAPHSREQLPAAAESPPILVLVETSYIHDQLAESAPTAPEQVPDISALSTYLVWVAEERYARSAQIKWQSGPIAFAAAMTRHQYSGQDIVLIADATVTGEAASTARRVGRPIRRWILGAESPPSSGSEVCDTFHLPITELLSCVERRNSETMTASRTASLARTPAPQPSVAENRRGEHATAASTDFDSLSYLDDTLYRRPIRGVTGRGNTHTLRRQATLVGSTYALRWLSVVNDETRDRLVAVGDGVRVPGRLYGDLLGFTETHGLPSHDSAVIKDRLRRGFWAAVHGDSRTVPGIAA